MAEIVFGFGTSHSPQASTPAELWPLHAERDRANPALDFEALVAAAPAAVADQLGSDEFERKDKACQAAIGLLAERLAAAELDAVVVIGNDQREFFGTDLMPAIAVFTGAELVDQPVPEDSLHPSVRPSAWARHAEEPEPYPVVPELAAALTGSLSRQGFDVTEVAEQHDGRTVSHAFTFVRRRLMPDRPVPMVPLFLNSYYPPNKPTPGRCFDLGVALRRAIEEHPEPLRVGVAGSGGLSHFVVDEGFDRSTLDAMGRADRDALAAISPDVLQSGTSETLNWIAAAGALTGLTMDVIEYIPAYRSPAATGCGLAFASWQ